MNFVHLRAHSAYSLLEGAVKIKDLVKLALTNEMPALALTDSGNLFGALEFSIAASEQGVQPIIGCQIAFQTMDKNNEPPATNPILLLVQNQEGYQNLLKLVSRSFLRGGTTAPHITPQELEEHAGGLILVSGGFEGPIGRLVLAGEQNRAQELTLWFQNLFQDRFYLELSRLGFAEEAKCEGKIIKLALEYNIPLVATNNVLFEKEAMFEAHDALLCVAQGTYVATDNRKRLTPQHFFKSSEAMGNLFSDIPEAIENTTIIAKRCAFRPLGAAPTLPLFASDTGRTEAEELRFQAQQGLQQRLEKTLKTDSLQEYQERLDHELTIIERMGYCGYFLIVSDFVIWAKKNNIPVGPGRGSGAGSIVAWVLSITNIDPIRFQLLFERFLNPERVSMPDFDIDFCQDRRDEVIHYVQQRYGKEKVAQIITFGKLQARAVLRDVGRVLQMPYSQVDRLSKMIPNNPAAPVTLQEAIDGDQELRRLAKSDASVGKLLDIALQLEGLYRHASTHAAGIIIGDRSLDELIPLYKDPKSDMQVTQFNMKDVEKAGLVKFDFLGLKTLTILEEAASMVRATQNPLFSIDDIPLDDEKTFALLKRVEASGIFQLESTGMQDVLRKLKPDRLEELIALVALYRPGPMDDIPRYLACKHGEEKVTYLHPMLEDILKETFGVMVYQEQVMQIAQVMGGYSLGRADLLRRAMGKKIKSEMEEQRKLFVEGAEKNKVEKNVANQIFDQMAKFAGYGFNKSHSAPYGLITYQTAYMKANHPLEFMAATMTYDMGNTDKLNYYRQELALKKIPLLPPDMNASSVTFQVEGDAVRYALTAVKNVGAQAMEEVVRERKAHGPFKDIWDFARRLGGKVLHKRQMESLIQAGAFDSLNPCRKSLFDALEKVLIFNASVQNLKSQSKKSLFSQDITTPQVQLSHQDDWPMAEKLKREYESIGFYLSSHPLKAYSGLLARHRVIPMKEASGFYEQTISMAGVLIAVQERLSKKGQKFAFITLSDVTGDFEVALFAEVFLKYRNLLTPGTPLLLRATVKGVEQGALRLIGQSMELLEFQALEKDLALHITLHAGDMKPLQAYLETLPSGSVPVYLHVPVPQGLVEIKLQQGVPFTTELPLALESLSIVKSVTYKDTPLEDSRD